MTSSPFAVYNDAVRSLFGPEPKLEMLFENNDYPFAHGAGVFVARDNVLFVTSNLYRARSHEVAAAAYSSNKAIQITKIKLPPATNGDSSHGGNSSAYGVQCEEINPEGIAMANGGAHYGDDSVVFCAQGSKERVGGLVVMDTTPPYATRPLVSSFFGRPFNSPSDVAVARDGAVWFTDPSYGFEQGIRTLPQLPNQVYRYDPAAHSLRAVADGFGRPNGICFSPDESVVYITDTDGIHGDGSTDPSRASTIYAFDVATYHDQPFLVNRRLFAMADTGIPDGIKCDVHGNVYSGCGDGINIWSPSGVLLGKILVAGGTANLCFGRNGELFLLNEHKLWRATLAASTKGALLGI
ncbi:hypothetical protein HMPREF1624_02242 [Sporothrix schenckii ATCC 58251]|uniref:SMP-30/Gluconolactonase/LRE-like region domain-containing protein n=1 Tax=Sporothrix schenckii (strain ATCC 58251 / de Perez 2211183) TaxID=1391915 RepID=U7Q2S4_SPOS1|nr:hypothetical protein HMPREF1624_02242 [Sporothrix schenckii ATCC 58251]